MSKQEVFIIGAKGIPAKYGGFESFVEQLTARKTNCDLHYNIACRKDLSDNKNEMYEYNGATCFNVEVPNIGPAKAILYDIQAFKFALKIIKKRNIKKPIVYVLACRIGPAIGRLKRQLKKYDGILYINPDGHEWLRAKWNYFVRRYWKYSEKLMVKNADLLICDSQSIEKYIKKDYANYNPNTTYISYGSDIIKSTLTEKDARVKEWYNKNKVKANGYYLIVGRFVPENNYETMIKEFENSRTKRDLVIISNVEHNKFYEELLKKTHFNQDKRIKFVGTVYDNQLLKYIRENAYGYLHGHEVGGTNPSLLEALGSTKINLLFNVGFNREVGGKSALYWSKDAGVLSSLINSVDQYTERKIDSLGLASKKTISERFDWDIIIKKYEKKFNAEEI